MSDALDLAPRKMDLDDHLNAVDYSHLNSPNYVPSAFALDYMNWIKLVNGLRGEDNKTPPVHLAMMDKLAGDGAGGMKKRRNLANLCHRGLAKTTLMFEYLAPYIAMHGGLPNFGPITGMIYVSDSMDNGVKKARQSLENRWKESEFLQHWLPRSHFTDIYIEFENRDGGKLGINLYGAKTGIRGNKIFNRRPVMAVLDDLISDEDAMSKAAMDKIKATVYGGVAFSLDPNRSIKLLNGTPFNKEDLMVEAVESGAWDVNVWPVCERWPVPEHEFRGSWPDRFTYDYVKESYDFMVENGKTPQFMQEMMLRISTDEERLVTDAEIRTYSRVELLRNRQRFNYYITTDFATSEGQRADFSVISVWAYNTNGDWMWVDGICARQTLDKTFDDLFRLCAEYQPQAVGVEVTGQQQGFIKLLQREMVNRNCWFTFASDQDSGAPGIRPVTSKLARFNRVVPFFKVGKIMFPEEMKTTEIMGHFYGQIRLATKHGLKGKDDCLDTISMLASLNPWKPSEGGGHHSTPEQSDVYDLHEREAEASAFSSYIV